MLNDLSVNFRRVQFSETFFFFPLEWFARRYSVLRSGSFYLFYSELPHWCIIVTFPSQFVYLYVYLLLYHPVSRIVFPANQISNLYVQDSGLESRAENSPRTQASIGSQNAQPVLHLYTFVRVKFLGQGRKT